MKTDATLIKGTSQKVRGLGVCCNGIRNVFVLVMTLVFSTSFLMAQSDINGNEPLIIVKKGAYPGADVVPQEVQDFLAEYGTQLSNGPLGTIEPGEAPTIENCPADQTVECFGDVGHTASELEYTINCGPNGIIIIYEPPGILETGSCPGTEYVVTYDVWDQCGNNVTCDQIFTIDNPAPEITFCPEGGEIESADEAVADLDALEFTFSCPEDPLCSEIEVNVELVESYEPCIGEIFTFTYTVTDGCGRSDECEQVFVIPPDPLVVECSDDEVVECFEDIDPSEEDIEISGLIDDVEFNVSIGEPVLVSGEEGCSGAVYEVTYTVTDDCDREASCTRSYTLENEGPSIEAPADVIIECASDAAPDLEGVEVTTSCDYGSEVSVEGPNLLEGDGFCDGSLWEFVYTVEDECGRSASATQSVTISNDGPTIVAPEDVTIECAADAEANPEGAVVTTSCDLGSSVSVEGPNLIEGNGTCPGSVWEFVYTVTDDCGRTAEDVQQVFIDNNGPSIEVPADATVECTEDTSPESLGMAEASDPCEEVEAVFEDVIIQESCPQIIERLWSVTNSCGLTAEGVQTITIEDTTPPELIMPEVVEGEVTCSDVDPDEAAAFANGELSEEEEAAFLSNASSFFVALGLIPQGAEDECGSASWSEIDVNVDVVDDCPVLVTLECIFIAVDECGNQSETASTFINIVDNTAPEITCPMNIEISCEESTSPDVTGMATATDDCGGEVSIDFMDEIISDGCPTIIQRMFTATDACGNSSSCMQEITITYDDPTIVAPEDVIIECASEAAPDIEGAVISTACELEGVVTAEGPNLIEGDGFCDGSIWEFVYTVTDDCGRTATDVQQVFIENEGPTLVAPEDVTIECASEAAPDIEGVEVSFSCDFGGEVTAEGPNLIEGDGFCDGSVWEFVYSVEDDCGRVATDVQQVFIENEGPTLVAPEDVTIECASEAAPDIEGVEVSFSCDFGGEVTAEGPILIEGDGFCPGSVWEFVYSVTDDCGRTAIDTQQVFIDNEGPSIEVPADATVECGEDISPESLGIAEGFDPCGDDLEVGFSDVVVEESCPEVIERTWTVTNSCGLSASGVQTITIEDTTPPVLNMPEVIEGEVSCSEIDPEEAEAFANGELSEEEEAEFLSNASSYFVEFGLIPEGAIDECGSASWNEIGVNVEVVNECPVLVTLECVFIAVDECGNQSETASTFINIIDETAPELIMPEVIEGEATCEDIDPSEAEAFANGELSEEEEAEFLSGAAAVFVELGLIPVDAIDDCGPAEWVEIDVNVEVLDECPNLVQLECIFVAIDECGNESEPASTFITIVDETAPEISCPEDVEISCEESTSPDVTGMATATDDCSGEVSVTYQDVVVSDGCPTIIERTFTAVDDCENSSSCTQTITITFDAPTIVAPEDVIIECASEAAPDIEGVEFSTACELGGVVSAEGPNLIEGDGFCDGSVWEFVYTVTDDCGNSASDVQQVFIENDGPTLVAPEDVTIECASEAAPNIEGVEVSFSCDFGGEVSVEGPNLIEGDGFCDGSVWEFVYSVEDDCGRVATDVQQVFIENEGPSIVAPEDVTIECASEAAPNIDGAEVSAACDLGTEVTAEGPILIEGDGFCDGSVWEFIYTVEDDCGRTAVDTQQVFIENEGPSIEAPADVEVICIDDFVANADDATASAACDLTTTVEVSDPVLLSGQGSCNLTQYEVTYTVTDQCGRSASDVQIVTCVNEGLEIINEPVDLTVECYDDITPDPWSIEYFSPCSSDVFIQVTPPTQLCCDEDCPGAEYAVIYTITNDCGDEEVIEQIFTIDNDGPEIISCGEDMEVDSPDDIVVSPEDVEYVTACGTECEVTVVSEPEIVEEECATLYIYTYEVLDDCGRLATCERTFTVASDDPNCTDDNDCPDFTTFYVNHGDGVSGSDVYTVDFSGSEAILEFEVNVEFEVHMAFDAENSILYLVNANGSFIRAYDPANDSFLGDLPIDGDIDQLFAVEFNPNDGLIYVGDANDDQIFTIDPNGATGIPVFFADAPVQGGDLALRDGNLYLANRANSQLFIVNQDDDGISDGTDDVTLVGSIPDEVNGMTPANNQTDLIVASGNTMNFTKVNAADGSTVFTYMATLDGEPFELINGDMASGCANNFGIPPCDYRLYYTHQPQGGSYDLLQVELSPLGDATYTTLLEDLGSAHIALDPSGDFIYIVGNNLRVYDVEAGEIITTLDILGPTGGPLSGFPSAVCDSDGTLYAGKSSNNQIYSIDVTTGVATPFGPSVNVNGGDLIFVDGDLWSINRGSNTFTKVLTGEEFSVDVDEINGAAVLENGNVLLADGNGESLLKEVDLGTLEVVMTYDIDLPLFNGDLAGRCTDGEEVEETIVYGGADLSLPSEVYPNPAVNSAVITFEPVESVRTQVELYDLSGRPMSTLFNAEVKGGLEYRVNVNARSFEDGIYIYRVVNGSHQVTKKLIISK